MTESENVRVNGPILSANKPDGCGRVYSAEVLAEAVEEFQGRVRDGSSFGFLADGDMDPRRRLSDAACVIRDVRMAEGGVMAEVEMLGTPVGRQVIKMLRRKEER